MEPTAERVQENIEALPSILNDIIKAEECTMREISHINNTGKRYTKFKGVGVLKKKPAKRDRKSTLVIRPCHPDLKNALGSLIVGKIPEGVLARIAIEGASAALLLEDGTAQVDNPDAESSEGDFSDDEVSFFHNFFQTQFNALSMEMVHN
jgi:hypothetical protein